MSEIQSNLVAGSVWERQSKRGVKSSIVLMVTNQDLSPEVQAKNPVQVVFMTESHAVLSTDVETFIHRRTFTGMNPTLVSHLEAISDIAFDEDAEDDSVLDIGAISVDESQFRSLVNAADTGETEDDEDGDDDHDGAGELFLNVGPHPFKDALESSFIGYREAPLFHTGDTLHTLSFMLDEQVTMQMIHAAFNPVDPNAIQKFEITVPVLGSFQIEHEGTAGVFLESNGSFSVATLNLTTKADFRVDINSPVEEVVEAPAVAAPVVAAPAPQTAAPQTAAAQAVVVVS